MLFKEINAEEEIDTEELRRQRVIHAIVFFMPEADSRRKWEIEDQSIKRTQGLEIDRDCVTDWDQNQETKDERRLTLRERER